MRGLGILCLGVLWSTVSPAQSPTPPSPTLVARRAQLQSYFSGSVPPARAIPARRDLILWFIQHAPADPVLLSSAATIDPSGHSLADPLGYQRAAAAWRAQTARPGLPTAALLHAAYFFKLHDRLAAIQLLETATAREPANREFGARLGDAYALAILGITMINRSGFPTQADPRLTQHPAAQHARAALATSRNPFALAKAGYQLAWQGSILLGSQRLAFDPFPAAQQAVERAVELAPGDAEVAAYLDRYNELQRTTGRGAPANRTAAAASAAASPPSALDWSRIQPGMSRQDLLRLAAPHGRTMSSEDGHLVETYQYLTPGSNSPGRVRLTDGVVTAVHPPPTYSAR